MFSFSLPFGGQVAISVLVYAVLNLFAGVIDCFAPGKGSKIANYIFRFAVGGCAGTLIGIHFITKASGKHTSIIIDVISGLWGATMFLWIFNIDENKRNKLLAIISGIVFSKANVHSLFWGFSKWSILTVTFTLICIIAALYVTKAVSDKGVFAVSLIKGMIAIASCSAYILKSDIKGLMIAMLIAITSLTFHANVLKNEEAKKVIDYILNKNNIEKIKETVVKAKELV